MLWASSFQMLKKKSPCFRLLVQAYNVTLNASGLAISPILVAKVTAPHSR